MPIELINNNKEYNNTDAFNVEILNKDSSSYHVKVALEKYSDFSLWEVVTNNILMKKSEINGEAKGVLAYYLAPLGRIKIKMHIKEISFPNLVVPGETRYEPAKKYRLSTSKATSFETVMSGKFRFSVEITGDQKDGCSMIIKSAPFFIKN